MTKSTESTENTARANNKKKRRTNIAKSSGEGIMINADTMIL